MSEMFLGMVTRHLSEGFERICRQEDLVAKIGARCPNSDILADARVILAEMRECQKRLEILRWELEDTDRFKHPVEAMAGDAGADGAGAGSQKEPPKVMS